MRNILNVSRSLEGVHIGYSDFQQSLEHIGRNDLVFLDPPYTVSHNHNGFIEYNRNLFSLDDQYRLNDFITEVRNIGAYYILTNAAHDRIRNIFYREDE